MGKAGISNFGTEGADHALIHLLKEEFQSPKLVISTLDDNGEEWKLPNLEKGECLNEYGNVVSSCEGTKVACALPKIENTRTVTTTESKNKAVGRDAITKVVPCGTTPKLS